jgi:hypothetical protein
MPKKDKTPQRPQTRSEAIGRIIVGAVLFLVCGGLGGGLISLASDAFAGTNAGPVPGTVALGLGMCYGTIALLLMVPCIFGIVLIVQGARYFNSR